MPRAIPRHLGRLLALLVALAPGTTPAATPLLVSPTLVQLPATGRRSAVIEVTNQSDAPVDLQLRGYDWTQPDGADVLVPSETLAISPAITTVAPHAKQLFRILDRAPPGAAEKAFRIRINELPKAGGAQAIAIALEFLVPAFRSAGGTGAELAWTRGQDRLIAENRGGQHLRLMQARAVTAAGTSEPLAATPLWLLAGGRRTFPISRSAVLRVVGTTDAGTFDAPLPAPRP